MKKEDFILKGVEEITAHIQENSCDNMEDKIAHGFCKVLDIMYDMVMVDTVDIESVPVLKVKRNEKAKQFDMIKIAKDGDVGFDLVATLDSPLAIYPGDRGVIPTGIFLEIPKGRWASIEARSSTSKRMLIVPKGVIDEGYRGELFAVLLNVGTEKQIIKHGDRLTQLILHKRHSDMIIQEVDELSESERGDSGFGSTGATANRS